MRAIALVWLTFALLALTGCGSPSSPKPTPLAPLVARFYLETQTDETGVAVQLPQSGVRINVAPKPVFSEYDILNAEVARVELGLCLLVQLTPAATRDLYRWSVPAQGRRLVLSLDEVCLGVHRIERAMADGVVPIFLEVPDEQLPGIVARLKFTSTEMARVAKKSANN